MAQHPFQPDPHTEGVCACGLPQRNRRHDGSPQVVTPPLDQVPPTGLHHPSTSHAAATSITPGYGSMKARVLAYVDARPHGATSDEVEAGLSSRHQSVSSAVNALMNDGHLIEARGPGGTGHVTRATRTGRQARVWVLSESGRTVLARVREAAVA